MCFSLNCFLVILLNKRMNSCQVTFCNLIRFSHLESSDGSQPRTHLIARNAFSWRDHFYLQGDDDDILPHFLCGSLKKKKVWSPKCWFFLFCLGLVVLLWAALLWPNSLPECGCRRVDVAIFQRKKWQLWPYDSYHLNLNIKEENFYRNDSWVLKGLPPCRTFSWGILAFSVRLAKASCFLEEEQKTDKYCQSWKKNFKLLENAFDWCNICPLVMDFSNSDKYQKQHGGWLSFSVSACQKKGETYCSTWICWNLLYVLIPVADCFCHRSQTYKIALSSLKVCW